MKKIITITSFCVLCFQLRAQISFTNSSSPGVGVHPFSVVAADVNGDGKLDLISANAGANRLSVMTNNGSGGFALSGTYAVGNTPTWVTAADVNGDGKVDLISANSTGNSLTVLTNNGSGGFALAASPNAGSRAWSVTAADLNGDGLVDLVCANNFGNSLTVLTNNGSGGFVLAATLGVGKGPVSVTAADVNGDGKLDLICANSGGTTLSVLTNNGSGRFVLASSPQAGSAPYSAVAADVNGDGKPDLICANYNDNTLSVLTNDGSGRFATSGTYTVGHVPVSVTAADINGDGNMDLICANYNDNSLSVLTNNGTGGFALAVLLNVGSEPEFITAADVNGDGKLDLITANYGINTLSILLNTTPFSPAGIVSWWPGEGDGSDIIGGNTAMLQSSVSFGAGEVGQAFELNQFGAYLSVPASASLNVGTNEGLTVEAWINLTNVSGFHPIVEWNNGSGGLGTHFWVGSVPSDAGVLMANLVDTVGVYHGLVSAQNAVSANVFQHVALTYDRTSGVGTLYVNGVVAAQANLGSFVPQTSYNFWMGVRAGDTPGDSTYGSYLGGALDELSLYKRALTQSEIQTIYNAGSAGKYKLTPPPARDGKATAMETNGFVIGVNLTDGGYGYTNVPLIRFIGGGGSGAGATAVVSNGIVTGIIVTNNGSGYTNAPLVFIDPPYVTNPVLGIAPMSFLLFSNLTLGGTYQLQQSAAWYWTNQPVSFTATNAGYTQMVPGVAGSGSYRLALKPVPAQAFATPVVNYGFVVHAAVTSGGSGYVTSPAVSITGGGGTNATATAQISGGVVTNIVITAPGTGYTGTPLIKIAAPPAAAVAPLVLPVMRLDSSLLAPFHNYQVQFMPGLGGTWGNWGNGLFISMDVTNSQFLFITNDIGFFRLQYMP